MGSLQAENTALKGHAAAHNPEQVEKLYSEVANLRERVGELSNLKVSPPAVLQYETERFFRSLPLSLRPLESG